MLSAKGRVIMVSGANRGIGLATATCLAALGYQLSLGARQPKSIPVPEQGTNHMVHHWDAEDQGTSAAWVTETIAYYGRIDGVVLNAGVELGGSLESGTEEDIDRMFAVNFKSLFTSCKSLMITSLVSLHHFCASLES